MARRFGFRPGPKADRFNNYRTIDARYASVGGCGHPIAKGERIGWNAGAKKTMCSSCWERWESENAEAQAYEDNLSYGGAW